MVTKHREKGRKRERERERERSTTTTTRNPTNQFKNAIQQSTSGSVVLVGLRVVALTQISHSTIKRILGTAERERQREINHDSNTKPDQTVKRY